MASSQATLGVLALSCPQLMANLSVILVWTQRSLFLNLAGSLLWAPTVSEQHPRWHISLWSLWCSSMTERLGGGGQLRQSNKWSVSCCLPEAHPQSLGASSSAGATPRIPPRLPCHTCPRLPPPWPLSPVLDPCTVTCCPHHCEPLSQRSASLGQAFPRQTTCRLQLLLGEKARGRGWVAAPTPHTCCVTLDHPVVFSVSSSSPLSREAVSTLLSEDSSPAAIQSTRP